MYMDQEKRALMRNAYRAVTKAKASETGTITHEELLEELRRPLPPPAERETDRTIRSNYTTAVINAGVRNVHRVASYEESALIVGKSIEAVRQAAYRGTIMKTTEYRNGREQVGVYLKSLADWCRWTPKEYAEAAQKLESMRRKEG